MGHVGNVEEDAVARRNLTIQLDDEVIGKARVLAAHRSTSISGLVTAEIERLVGEREQYESARTRALARLLRGYSMGGPPYANRADLYDRG